MVNNITKLSLPRALNLWYAEEQYQKASFLSKLLSFSLIFGVIADHVLISVELAKTTVTIENLAEFFNNTALVLGSAICMIRMVLNWTDRAQVSTFLADLNEKFKLAAKESDRQDLQNYLDLYLFMSWMTISTVTGGNLFAASTLVYSVITGKPYLKLYTPFEEESYDPVWWCKIMVSSVSAAVAFTFYSFMHCQLMECGILLAFLHRVKYEKLRNDLGNMKNEQLRSIFVELKVLRQLTKTYLAIIIPDQFMLWAVGSLILGCCSVCLVVEIKNGLVAVLSVVIYPIFALCNMLGWSLVGGYYEENVSRKVVINYILILTIVIQVSQLIWSMYSSDWIDLPIRSKKTIAIMMAMNQKPPTLYIPPFFELSKRQFTNVIDFNTYQTFGF